MEIRRANAESRHLLVKGGTLLPVRRPAYGPMWCPASPNRNQTSGPADKAPPRAPGGEDVQSPGPALSAKLAIRPASSSEAKSESAVTSRLSRGARPRLCRRHEPQGCARRSCPSNPADRGAAPVARAGRRCRARCAQVVAQCNPTRSAEGTARLQKGLHRGRLVDPSPASRTAPIGRFVRGPGAPACEQSSASIRSASHPAPTPQPSAPPLSNSLAAHQSRRAQSILHTTCPSRSELRATRPRTSPPPHTVRHASAPRASIPHSNPPPLRATAPAWIQTSNGAPRRASHPRRRPGAPLQSHAAAIPRAAPRRRPDPPAPCPRGPSLFRILLRRRRCTDTAGRVHRSANAAAVYRSAGARERRSITRSSSGVTESRAGSDRPGRLGEPRSRSPARWPR